MEVVATNCTLEVEKGVEQTIENEDHEGKKVLKLQEHACKRE